MGPDAIRLSRTLAPRSFSEREEYYALHEVPLALRAEVETLLQLDSATGHVVDAPWTTPRPRPQRKRRRPDHRSSSVRTACWSRVGEGGMGEVWLAEQTTPGPPHRSR